MSSGGGLRGWWRRETALLREGYEAQLLADAQEERREASKGLLPGERGAAALPIPVEIRPRTVPFGELLRPVVLQFTLPCLALSVLAELTQGPLIWRHGVVASLALTAAWLGLKWWFFTGVGRWLFRQRWTRLREECYERWQWRAAALRSAPPAPESAPEPLAAEAGRPGA
ncbi:MAG TPA: hypothetical protein VKA84_00680 [Gemmatimonadaceae bacterium]|nr:hypothetical protein [Gemmatimonadaceae bacterium]